MDPQNEQKDQNVMAFMMQLVQEKHGDQVEASFLDTEANRLYDEFGDNLVTHFEPMLSEEHKKKFDELVSQSVNQDELLAFLMDSIENLEEKIMQVLMQFRDRYMASGAEEASNPI